MITKIENYNVRLVKNPSSRHTDRFYLEFYDSRHLGSTNKGLGQFVARYRENMIWVAFQLNPAKRKSSEITLAGNWKLSSKGIKEVLEFTKFGYQ